MDALQFQLTPGLLDPAALKDPEAARLQQLYECCALTVFGQPTGDRLDRKPGAKETLEASCQEAGCSLRLFILTTMFGHRQACPERRFFANMLLGPAAIKRVSLYRGACAKEFGTFDAEALGVLMKDGARGLEPAMLNSEIIAGTWIVGYKLRFPGAYGLPFYRSKELDLDPAWLAIEPSYARLVLLPDREAPTDISDLKRHRFSVAQTLHSLKRDRAKARAVFLARESAAPEAVRRVAAHFGFDPQNFVTKEPVVTDLLKFWGQLAIAIKNVQVERYLDGDRGALALLRTS